MISNAGKAAKALPYEPAHTDGQVDTARGSPVRAGVHGRPSFDTAQGSIVGAKAARRGGAHGRAS